jgi:hypothetical protein
MKACQDYAQFGSEVVVSPHLKYDDDVELKEISVDAVPLKEIAIDKRKLWEKWSTEINNSKSK